MIRLASSGRGHRLILQVVEWGDHGGTCGTKKNIKNCMFDRDKGYTKVSGRRSGKIDKGGRKSTGSGGWRHFGRQKKNIQEGDLTCETFRRRRGFRLRGR